jgi:hypothetical protein
VLLLPFQGVTEGRLLTLRPVRFINDQQVAGQVEV